MQIGSFKLSTPMALLIGGLGSCVLCCGVFVAVGAIGEATRSPADRTATAVAQAQGPAARPTSTPRPDATPANTPTPDGRPVLGAVEVFKGWDASTAIQKPDYEKGLIGRHIADTGKVGEVYESGYVYLTVQGSGALQRVNLYDLPRAVLSGLTKDQNVKFEGTIRKFNNLLGQTIEVSGTTIAQ